MTKFKTYCYEIRLLSNMHSGSGDATYGIIDNLVQRDPVTNYPIIHASSLKGALREFFTIEKGRKDNGDDKIDPFIHHVFGSNPKQKENLKNGEYRFLSADLFLLPVRSSNQQFYLATNQNVLKNFLEKFKLLGITESEIGFLTNVFKKLSTIKTSVKPIIFKGEHNTMLEDYETTIHADNDSDFQKLNLMYDEKLALFGDNFKEIANNLPVIARNQLESGKSENLWYEEIVPHQTRFITFVSVPKNDEYFKTFNTELTSSLVQIGANGSIGYGLCEFLLLNPEK